MPDYLTVFENFKRDLEGALAQIHDDEFARSPGGSANSVAVIVQHLSGNLKSRFTDFLTSDGEKPWREREGEFQVPTSDRASVMAAFGEAWQVMVDNVSGLTDADLTRTITIRGQPLTVDEALLRSVTHFAGHVGQVIIIGKQVRGDDWNYLSIPPGQSKPYNDNSTGR